MYNAPDSAVAVIGMACKFPGADSLEQLWEVLETGSVQCRELPDDRFPDWRFQRRAYPKRFKANVITDVDAFDHKFFKVASREAKFMDPQQRLALEVTYQALESAGYFSQKPSEREKDVGCYMATCMNEYHENVACHPPTAFSLTGSIRPFIAGKVSHYFGFTGPAMMFDTACAASGTAIHQACRAVMSDECSIAVAGGTNIFISPDTFQNLAAGHFISPSGQSKSFDAAADGYCRAEGVAFVVLKKLCVAVRDGDPIKGVIASTAVGQNANETSITVPHSPSQMKLYRKALHIAGLNAQDISYVEAHGTGTRKGDPIEAESIRGVFGSPHHHNQRDKVYLGSLKSNIGHTEASSGISGLIKVLLMMQKGVIPRQALFDTLNPAIPDLARDGIEIPMSNVIWSSKFKAACVNNYGASGSNAVMIVTQPPTLAPPLPTPPDMSCPISISAFSHSSLTAYCSTLLDYLNEHHPQDSITDLAYHLSRRRNSDLPFSVSATISSHQELKDLLVSVNAQSPSKSEQGSNSTVIFFGGQTGKSESIPRILYESSTVFRRYVDDCDTTLRAIGAPGILPNIFEPGLPDDIVVSHSMLFSRQYAHAMTWIDCGLRPDKLIGHSLGQITALCVSGVMTLHDCLRFVTERARLIEKLWGPDRGSMIAVETDLDTVSSILSQNGHLNLEIACHNGPQSFVLAGKTSSVSNLEDILKSSPGKIRWKRLQMTNAFHSVLTEPVIKPLQTLAEQFTFSKPRFVLETCSKDATWQQVTPNLVASHTREPVYFYQAVQRISAQCGPCIWLEVGSNSGVPLLRRALGAQASLHKVMSLKSDSGSLDPLAELTADLSKLGLNVRFWPFQGSQMYRHRDLNLPPYQFDKSRHWLEWKASAGPTVEAQQPTKDPAILQLKQKSEKGGVFHIHTQSERWQKACAEYQVHGDAFCPLSLLLDLVFEAVGRTRSVPVNDSYMYNLHDFQMERLIPANSPEGLSMTILDLHQLHSFSFSVSDVSVSSHVYASGFVSTDENWSERDFARYQRLMDMNHLRALSSDLEADSIAGNAVHRSLADFLRVPRHKQAINKVTAKEKEAIGYLKAQTYSLSEALENFIRVPLLCLNGLRDRHSGELHINTGVGMVQCRRSLHFAEKNNRSWAVYVQFSGSENPQSACDLFVIDVQDEQLCMVLLDVTFSSINIEPPWQTIEPAAPIALSNTSHVLNQPEVSEYQGDRALPKEAPTCSPSDQVATKLTGLQEVRDAVYHLLVRVTDVELETLQDDVTITDLGIDSLMGMEVIDEINKFFSITIDATDAVIASHLGALCKLVANQTTKYPYHVEASPSPQTDKLDREKFSSGTRTQSESLTNYSIGDGGSPSCLSKSSTPDVIFT